MYEQSKKVELAVIKHAALENNRAYLLRTETTKVTLITVFVSIVALKTTTVTPSFFITFLISPCLVTSTYQVSSEIYGGFF